MHELHTIRIQLALDHTTIKLKELGTENSIISVLNQTHPHGMPNQILMWSRCGKDSIETMSNILLFFGGGMGGGGDVKYL